MRHGAACSLLALLALSCAGAPRGTAAGALEVHDLSVDFPAPDQGTLRFSVDVPASERVSGVSWELAVSGLRGQRGQGLRGSFAAGYDTKPAVATSGAVTRLTVTAQLAYRHHGWRDGATFLDASVRGVVVVSDGLRELRFAGRKEVLSRGAPVFDVPAD